MAGSKPAMPSNYLVLNLKFTIMKYKEVLLGIIDAMEDFQVEKFYRIVNAFHSRSNYSEFAKILDIDLKGCDYATPQNWYDKVNDLGINPRPFNWSPENKPINMNEEIMSKLIEFFMYI